MNQYREPGNWPVEPKNCMSTHGGAGYTLGDYVREDGKIVCCLCGSVLDPREPLPEWLKNGVTTAEGYQAHCEKKRQEWRDSRNIIERVVDFLFGR